MRFMRINERYVQEDGKVKDTTNGMIYDIYWVVDLLNLKENRINELEELLDD